MGFFFIFFSFTLLGEMFLSPSLPPSLPHSQNERKKRNCSENYYLLQERLASATPIYVLREIMRNSWYPGAAMLLCFSRLYDPLKRLFYISIRVSREVNANKIMESAKEIKLSKKRIRWKVLCYVTRAIFRATNTRTKGKKEREKNTRNKHAKIKM